MKPYYEDDAVTLHHGDCLDVLRELPDASVDAVVTDPPYGLGFMGKEWDSGKSFVERKPAKSNTFDHVGGNHNPTSSADASRTRRVESVKFGAWCEQWTTECLRVLKPGGHMLAFGGTRTWHRLACAVEDAGFEVRDSIAWLYGSGFPKSLDVSKAIDKAAGAEREVVGPGQYASRGRRTDNRVYGEATPSDAEVVTLPATPDAERWQGWGTALKPAFEPIVVGRKPLAGTVAANVLAHGTGALNVDGCRVGMGGGLQRPERRGKGDTGGWAGYAQEPGLYGTPDGAGRWPANVLLDDTQAAELDRQSGTLTSGANTIRRGSDKFREAYGDFKGQTEWTPARGADSGGASRLFPTFRYEAKAPTSERPRYKREGEGGDDATDIYAGKPGRQCKVCGSRGKPAGGEQSAKPWPTCGHDDWEMAAPKPPTGDYVAHPTVKPLDLMRWLVRLVTPPGGVVLEPFAGSGTTAEACVLEGFRCIAIEREADYLPLIVQRLSKPLQPGLGIDFDGGAA